MHFPTAHQVRGLLRSLTVLLVCLGVATVSLASTAGSSRRNPGAAVVAAGRAHVGDTYTWGAAGPHTWDCSGLTSMLWRRIGGVKGIPRTSRQQQAWAVPLPAAQVMAGDLVFFGNPVTHVGLVKSRSRRANGTIVVHMIDAASSRNGVVERDVWKTGIIRYGRVPRRGMVPVTRSASPTHRAKAAHRARPTRVTRHAPVRKTGNPAVARKAAKLARAALGNAHLTDVQLVGNVWRRAGGGALPASRRGIVARGTRVAPVHARVGDLVVFAAPAAYVGVFVGGGQMVYASHSQRKVVLVHVRSGPGMQIVRLGR